ncbi:MAG: c-type cytochrome [Mycoplasmataceae bacterium]|nr:c-type cytochrome [Mycoplasmataceae bacterium]
MRIIILSFICILWAGYATVSFADVPSRIDLLAASCAACHGTEGKGESVIPTLAGVQAVHIAKQMLRFKSGIRKGTVMHHHAAGYTTAEIEDLAAYFEAQQ